MKKDKKINCIISACLLGVPCRWNKKIKRNQKAVNIFLKGQSIAICPEVMAGLKTPRPSCEIYGGDGENVLNGSAKVISKSRKDFSSAYIEGAQFILEQIVKKHSVERAVLKSGSPSCGVKKIYSGKFNGIKKQGKGVLTALLLKNGIKKIQEF